MTNSPPEQTDIEPAPAAGATTLGSTVENLYVRRTVTVLAVHEHEVQDITFMNTLATVSFSLCSASIAYAVGILTNAAFADEMNPTANAALWIAVPLCLIAALIFAVFGGVALYRRHSTLKQIRKQSQALS